MTTRKNSKVQTQTQTQAAVVVAEQATVVTEQTATVDQTVDAERAKTLALASNNIELTLIALKHSSDASASQRVRAYLKTLTHNANGERLYTAKRTVEAFKELSFMLDLQFTSQSASYWVRKIVCAIAMKNGAKNNSSACGAYNNAQKALIASGDIYKDGRGVLLSKAAAEARKAAALQSSETSEVAQLTAEDVAQVSAEVFSDGAEQSAAAETTDQVAEA